LCEFAERMIIMKLGIKMHGAVLCAVVALLVVSTLSGPTYSGCLDCPKDSECFTDWTECVSFLHCTFVVTNIAAHWKCTSNGPKTTCYHYGDLYNCASLRVCTWDYDMMECRPSIIPYDYRKRQSTVCY